jgi:hypothetical protein
MSLLISVFCGPGGDALSEPRKSSSMGVQQSPVRALGRFGLIVCLVVGPMVAIVVVFSGGLEAWYVRQFVAPGLQAAFGFTAARRPTLIDGNLYEVPVIVEIRSGGTFERLGIKPGDIIYCNHHGESDFWAALDVAQQGYRTSFVAIPGSMVAQGCGAKRRYELMLEKQPSRGARPTG